MGNELVGTRRRADRSRRLAQTCTWQRRARGMRGATRGKGEGPWAQGSGQSGWWD